MNAPAFWYVPHQTWQSALLSPFSRIYRYFSERRQFTPYRADIPVICVGNLSVGGTGKTPTVCALVKLLCPLNVHVVTRGYKSKVVDTADVHCVDPAHDTADIVGDEPLLLAWCLSAYGDNRRCWIAKNRANGVKAAQAAGAQVVILDDGFQNHAVEKDISLIVVDTAVHFGNKHLLPAGPLREDLAQGMSRATAVIAIGPHPYNAPANEACPVLRAHIHPRHTGLDIDGARLVAFAGIGRPQKFFDTLRAMGADLIEVHSFPDHHVYDTRVVARMLHAAQAQNAVLITTEKDAVKIPKAFAGQFLTLQIDLVFQDAALLKLRTILASKIAPELTAL